MADEQGYQTSGVSSWTNLATESTETNPELQWPKSLEVYDKMRREDSQVGSVLRAVTLPIRSAEWMIDPNGASDEVVALVATDLGLPVKGQIPTPQLRTRGRFSWDEHLRMVLLELVYGHSFFEQVYEYDGAKLRLKKLAWRPPRSIAGVDVASDGGLLAIKQRGILGRDIRIPIDRVVAYVNDREGGNWFGQSLLRTAYKNWLLKDRMLRAQALTVERNGLGVPVYTGAEVPDGVTGTERDEWLRSEKDAGLVLAKGFRAGEGAGASIPNSASLDLKGVVGKLPDTDQPIRYHDEQIARAVLAHFLNLGTETGSWALGSTFANFFTDSLNAVAAHIADVTQQHVVEDLVDLNFGPAVPAPRLVFKAIGSQHAPTAEAIKALIDAGALTPDPALEAYIRAMYTLPVQAEDDDPDRVRNASDAENARYAAETVQKAYLGVGKVLTLEEARDLVRRAGANLTGPGPAPTPPAPSEETS
jgi:phage gp29-like protein